MMYTTVMRMIQMMLSHSVKGNIHERYVSNEMKLQSCVLEKKKSKKKVQSLGCCG